MYDDTQQNRESVRTSTGYAHENFSKVYCDRVYFLCAERFETGSGFRPPSGTPPPPRPNESRVPPPPRAAAPFQARFDLLNEEEYSFKTVINQLK